MRAALAGVIALGALGCQRRARLPVALDLIAAFAATESGGATRRIDPAEPAARRHFLSGWSLPERSEDGGTVVWVSRSRARLWFDAGPQPSERVLVLGCESRAEPARPLLVMVRVNRRLAARLRLSRGTREERLVLPAALQSPGRNVLDLVVLGRGGHRGARRRGRGRHRFGLRSLRLESRGPPQAMPRARGDRLVLPPGTKVAYFLRLPPAARLAFDAVEGTPASLRVSIQADGGAERVVTSGLSRPGAGEVDLGGEAAGTLVRLEVRAAARGVTLLRPRIVGRAPALPAPRPLRRGERQNVILYVADTLRADHLGCYGYPRPTSSHIDAFARSAVLFEHAVAQSSWTRPAVASLLTGRYADEHGVHQLMDALRPGVPTMAEMLHAAGYATAGFVTNLNVAAKFGFARGFDAFHYLAERKNRPGVYASAEELNAAAFGWLEAHRAGPFFLYLHASDPHAPYRPSPAAASRFRPAGIHPTIDDTTPLHHLLDHPRLATPDNVALLAGLYDADVAALDRGFGALLDRLDRLGIARSTLVVFVADHGEEFHEHGGLEHGGTLYEEVVRVPLIVRIPGRTHGGERVAGLVRQIDILPTVLAALGLEVPRDLPGKPLLGRDGFVPPAGAVALMETSLQSRALAGVVVGGWKAVWREDGPANMELYDLGSDAGERRNRAADRPVVAGYARQTVSRRRLAAAAHSSYWPTDTRVVDPATERRLRALGYIGQR